MFSLIYQSNTIGDVCYLKMKHCAKMFGYPRLVQPVCNNAINKNNIDNCCTQSKNALLRVRPSSTKLKKTITQLLMSIYTISVIRLNSNSSIIYLRGIHR